MEELADRICYSLSETPKVVNHVKGIIYSIESSITKSRDFITSVSHDEDKQIKELLKLYNKGKKGVQHFLTDLTRAIFKLVLSSL